MKKEILSHIAISTVLSIFLHIVPSWAGNNTVSDCDCTLDSTKVIVNTNWQRVLLCFNVEKKLGTHHYICPKFQLIRCPEKKEIIEEVENYITPSIISVEQNSIVITRTHLMLDTMWNMVLVPVKKYSVKVDEKGVKRTDFTHALVTPKITKQQHDSLLVVIKELNEKVKVGKVPYPYDEKSIYLLLLGALNGNSEAKNLLKSITQKFDVDGAIAETLREIWIDY